MILINATDLSYGTRFSFIQEYFNLLCSDLASFPVARAVAASAAVPGLFNPVVLQNHSGCNLVNTDRLEAARKLAKGNADMALVTYGLESYADKQQQKYVHFVDGGISDNTGLRALYDIVEVSGGAVSLFDRYRKESTRHFVVIAVNASTEPVVEMDKSNKQPSMFKVMGAMTNVQLHRYNTATIGLIEKGILEWSEDLSSTHQPVSPYFIQVRFDDIEQPELKLFLNKIPTSFALSDEQVDALIKNGRELLRNNPVFQQLLLELK